MATRIRDILTRERQLGGLTGRRRRPGELREILEAGLSADLGVELKRESIAKELAFRQQQEARVAGEGQATLALQKKKLESERSAAKAAGITQAAGTGLSALHLTGAFGEGGYLSGLYGGGGGAGVGGLGAGALGGGALALAYKLRQDQPLAQRIGEEQLGGRFGLSEEEGGEFAKGFSTGVPGAGLSRLFASRNEGNWLAQLIGKTGDPIGTAFDDPGERAVGFRLGETGDPAVTYDPIGVAGGTVICTELHRQKVVSSKILRLVKKYRVKYVPQETYEGYMVWGPTMVKVMQSSKILNYIMKPVWVSVVTEMAHKIDPEIKGSKVGSALMNASVGISSIVGRLKRRGLKCQTFLKT